MKVFYTALFCIAGVLAADELKKEEAAGGYYDSPSAAAPNNGYYGYGGYGSYLPLPQLEDRNVCDLDASVLLVTDSRRHGHNRAVRVRCSEIASYDEDSCNVCCQHAARRDLELKNIDMTGFLAIVYEKNNKDKEQEEVEEVDEEDTVTRRKRGAKRHWDKKNEVEPTFVEISEFKPDELGSNVKCVCCAPKRKLPPPPAFYPQPAQTYSAPVYGAPAQSAPAYGAQAAPVYSAPAAAAPAYAAPAAAAPAYGSPAAAPAQAPVPVQY
ncbi:unnamed protein product [Auanema sp. JU1783]|nr:unnamed protein product [Auanema sp. JU1783]